MFKKILIFFVVFAFIFSLSIIYINRVVLPVTLKSLIIRGIEDSTHKKASLQSLQFNLFKGLVVRDISVYDESGPMLYLKEASCAFLIPPFFKRQVIIPGIKLVSPVIYIRRRADNSLDILDPFLQKSQVPAKSNFNIIINKINIVNATVKFEDHTLTPASSVQADNLNAAISLSLPAKLKFNLQFKITSLNPALVNCAGEYNLLSKNLTAKLILQDFSPADFNQYWHLLGFSFADGKIEALANIGLNQGVVKTQIRASAKDLSFLSDKFIAKINCQAQAQGAYELSTQGLDYSGKADVLSLDISGVDIVKNLKSLRGQVRFDKKGLYCDNASAFLFGLPISLKATMVGYENPLFNVSLFSQLNLANAQKILKSNFALNLPFELSGKGKLFVLFKTTEAATMPQISGRLDVSNAALKFKDANIVLANLKGAFPFNTDQLQWSQAEFDFKGDTYKTSGAVNGFQSPQARFSLSSRDLYLDSVLSLKDNVVNFSKLAGKYLNSKFDVDGSVSLADAKNLNADLKMDLKVDLADLEKLLEKFKISLKNLKPAGMVQANAQVSGNISNLKLCNISARIRADSLSLYGLNSGEFSLDYEQANGLGSVENMHMLLYDGVADAQGRINLASDNLPYWVSAKIDGIKLEKLKNDTGSKNENISGSIKLDAKISGFSNQLAKLTGAGKISITDGKLWELNLFKGLGQLIFVTDFASINFTQGSCDFVIQKSHIISDNINLISNVANLSGSADIGFDSSIDASLDVNVAPSVPVNGTFKDLTTAILGQAGRFGVIRITGTLKNPKHSFKPTVVDIFKGLFR